MTPNAVASLVMFAVIAGAPVVYRLVVFRRRELAKLRERERQLRWECMKNLHMNLVRHPIVVYAKFEPDFRKWEIENGWQVTPDA